MTDGPTQPQPALHEQATLPPPASDARALLGWCVEQRRAALAAGRPAPALIELLRQRGLVLGEAPSGEHPERLGPYLLGEPIGAGGMGEVVLATDPELGREVAIKLLHADRADDLRALERFLREARITGQLTHPAIVPVHQLGLDGDRVYMVMKRVRGATLAERVEGLSGRRAAAALPRLLDAFARVCDAMALAHSRGVIHRDLKPSNVMLGEFGEVQLLDWGLAKQLGERASDDAPDEPLAIEPAPEGAGALVTLDGALMGTPAYMPPEQARGEIERLDARSDVYSLGAILYTLLSGQPPYTGPNVWSVISQVLDGALEPPSQRAPERGVPWELEAVVLKAMAPEPEQRYPDAAALEAEVRRFLDGRVLEAARYTPLQHAGRWLRRHRWVLLAATLTALATGGLAWLGWQRQRGAQEAALRQRVSEARALASQPGLSGERWLERQLALHEATRALREARPRDEAAAAAQVEVALALSERLASEGSYPMARMMLDTARGAGLPEAEHASRLAALAERRSRRAREEARAASEALAAVRGRGQRLMFEEHLSRLVRMPRPHVVRVLLAGALDPDPRSARLAVEALGKIGDASTRARLAVAPLREPLQAKRACPARLLRPAFRQRYQRMSAELLGAAPEAELDAVELLSLLLLRAPLDADREWAIALAWALGRLRDPRGHPALHAKRDGSMTHSDFFNATQTPYTWIPLRDAAAQDRKLRRERARLLIRKGQPAEALVMLDALVGPDRAACADAVALLFRSSAHGRLKRYREAIADLTRALELEPAWLYLLSDRGHYHRQLGQPREALADFTRAAEALPDRYEPVYNRGVLHLDHGRYPQAINDLGEAVARIERARGPHAAGPLLAMRGIALLLHGRPQEAATDVARAAELAPGDGGVIRARGQLALHHNRFAQAERAAAELLRRDAADPAALELRGRAQADQGQTEAALATFAELLRLDPRNAPARLHRARIHFEASRFAESLAEADRALAILPNNPFALTARGVALAALGKHQAAVTTLDRAVRARPDHVRSRFYRARALRALQRLPEALRDLDHAVAKAPRDPQVRYERAATRLIARDIPGARADAAAVSEMTRPGSALHRAASTMRSSLDLLHPPKRGN